MQSLYGDSGLSRWSCMSLTTGPSTDPIETTRSVLVLLGGTRYSSSSDTQSYIPWAIRGAVVNTNEACCPHTLSPSHFRKAFARLTLNSFQ